MRSEGTRATRGLIGDRMVLPSSMRTMVTSMVLGLAASSLAAEQPDYVYFGTYTRGLSKGIYVARFDTSSGTLSRPELAGEAVNPSFVAIHPTRKYLYAVGESGRGVGAVSAFAIDATTGKLTLVNQASSGGAGPCHVTVDRAGTHVLVANYGSGSVAALAVKEGGGLGPATSLVQHDGSGPDKRRQEGPHAHSINLTADDRFALVADLGIDKVLVYRFDTDKGTLVPNDPPCANVHPGGGPRHVAFHPGGRFVYVINELASTITGFAFTADRGVLSEVQTLSTLPTDFKDVNTTAEVQVHPSGKFVYGSNRGHNSIAVFSVDPASGRLTHIDNVPSRGRTPRNFGIDATGNWMIVANQDSNNVVVYRIDAATGRPVPTGQEYEMGAPVCVKFMTAATTTASASSATVAGLISALGKGADWKTLGREQFAQAPLTRSEAASARTQLVKAWAAQITAERAQELRDKVIRIGDRALRFEMRNYAGNEGKRDLFISMHGGGGGPSEMNDQQWQNQVKLYQPAHALYVAPRAPTDTWDLWHQAHIDGLFARLIEDLVVLEKVDPNRVYLIGYSAGGDGVYQLGPRMAYRLAAVGAMAGHPNETSPLGLRNIGFALYTGENDAAYHRNSVAKEWKKKLDDLAAADPKGYPHKCELAAGCGHWMNGKEREAIPWMQGFTRNPVPDRVVWMQDDVTHESFYWLRVQGDDKRERTRIVASYAQQVVTLESADVKQVTVLLDDRMLDLDQPVVILAGGKEVFKGLAPRTIENCVTCLRATGDPELLFPAAVTVSLK